MGRGDVVHACECRGRSGHKCFVRRHVRMQDGVSLSTLIVL